MNELSYEVWTRCWWKTGAEGDWEKDAAFHHENPAKEWARGWYGTEENEHKDGRLQWQVRVKG